MIQLTRLDGTKFYINPRFIFTVELTEDGKMTTVNLDVRCSLRAFYHVQEHPTQVADLMNDNLRALP